MDFFEEVLEDVAEVAIIDSVVGGAGHNRHRSGYSNGPSIGVDVRDGDLVENFGNGMGIDLATGDLEFEIGNTGLDF